MTSLMPSGYESWVIELKQRIQSAQQRAALSVNRELILLYWQIGRDILERQQAQGWGAKVIKSDDDKPTLGVLLCKQQHRVVAEYALRGMTQPLGIAEYRLQLPDDLAPYLPSIEQIEAEFQYDE